MSSIRGLVFASAVVATLAAGGPVLRADEKPKIISFCHDTYVITGPSLRGGGMDVKFQLSLKAYPITINPKWRTYFAYTQTTTWDAYGKSAPFRDNVYIPAVYFEGNLDGRNTLFAGFEHRSNGRPYFGNPLASEGVEDYSRGMNYALVRWVHAFGSHSSLDMTLRAGISCGVGEKGDVRAHENDFTQDLYLYYIGYLTVGYKYIGEHVYVSANVSPVWNRSIANVNVRFAYEFSDRWPSPFVQFHYGFDEALCDCVKGGEPPVYLRFGILISHRCRR